MCSSLTYRYTDFSVPPDLQLLHGVRNGIVRVAEPMPFSQEELEDIRLAVGEAATNAMRYGLSVHRPEDRIEFRATGCGDTLTVEIQDNGPGFDADLVPLPSMEDVQPGGRGVFIMGLVMDRVEFIRLGKGMLVRMEKRPKALRLADRDPA